jgi:hypothetical protein
VDRPPAAYPNFHEIREALQCTTGGFDEFQLGIQKGACSGVERDVPLRLIAGKLLARGECLVSLLGRADQLVGPPVLMFQIHRDRLAEGFASHRKTSARRGSMRLLLRGSQGEHDGGSRRPLHHTAASCV